MNAALIGFHDRLLQHGDEFAGTAAFKQNRQFFLARLLQGGRAAAEGALVLIKQPLPRTGIEQILFQFLHFPKPLFCFSRKHDGRAAEH
ncbi:hypothetical protein D3C75_1109070 [compost metagenome]